MFDFKTIKDRTQQGGKKWKNMTPQAGECKIIPFSVADMELENAPALKEGLKDFVENYSFGYSMPTDRYYNAIINWMHKRHDLKLTPEDIVTSPGIVPAILNILEAFSNEGDGIIIFTPVYHPFFKVIETTKRVVAKCPLINDHEYYSIDFQKLEELAQYSKNSIILLCSPHNPVGRVWTKNELQKINIIAKKYNKFVISDEIHLDIIMPGHKHIVYSNLDEYAKNNSAICTAPSKSFNLGGVQVSNIIIFNPEHRKRFIQQQIINGYGDLTAFAYKVLEIVYNDCEPWFEEVLKLIQTNYLLTKNFLETNLPEVTLSPLEGTYLLWINLKPLGFSYHEQKIILEEAQLHLNDGIMFGAEEGYYRVAIACPTKTLEEALQRLNLAIKKRK